MRPTTVFGVIFIVLCFFMVICAGSTTLIVEARNQALRDTIRYQQDRIADMEIRLIQLQTLNDLALVLDYMLPPICLNELSKINHKLRQMK